MKSKSSIKVLFLSESKGLAGLGGVERKTWFTLRKFSEKITPLVVVSKKGYYQEALEEDNIQVEAINFSGFNFFVGVFRIGRFVRNNDIKIIHTSQFKSAVLARILKLFLPNLKVVSFYPTCLNVIKMGKIRKKLYILIDNLTSPISDKIFAVSDATKKDLIKQGLKGEVGVLYNGVDQKFINDASQKKANDDKITFPKNVCKFGFFGRLEEQKGLKYLLKAIAQLDEEERAKSFFIIVGKGSREDYLKDLVEKLKIGQYVYFSGFKKNPYYYMNLVDVVVQPSLFEGLSITMLEALALSKPILSSNINGSENIIDDGVNGFIVQKKSPDKLRKKLVFFIKNRKYIEKFGKKSYKKFIENFSIERRVENLTNIYNELVCQ
jgi:glycosyltransferase involved in cell wall biosynthesis